MREIELKIVPLPWSRARTLLKERGAEFVQSLFIETIYYDKDDMLKNTGRVLRLRVKRPPSSQQGEVMLGFKRSLSERGISIYEEYEVKLSNKEEMQSILLGLGFRAVSVVRKEREIWRYRGATITLDKLLSHPCVPEYGEVEVIDEGADRVPSIIESLGFHKIGKLMAVNTHQLIRMFC